jgi:hypothetical protein
MLEHNKANPSGETDFLSLGPNTSLTIRQILELSLLLRQPFLGCSRGCAEEGKQAKRRMSTGKEQKQPQHHTGQRLHSTSSGNSNNAEG